MSGRRGTARAPGSDRSAEPHRRTRCDHATETAEDYVEAIADFIKEKGVCRVADLARRFGVSHVTVTRTVARLCEAGLVTTEPYRPIRLTRRGRALAARCRRRHAIVLEFLIAIGVDSRIAALDAEGIEHHVSRQTLERFEAVTRRLNRQRRRRS